MKGNKEKRLTNPNKVNQFTAPDPRQALFLDFYCSPQSETFSNALQSAIKAGYEEKYANTITATMPKWLSENVGKLVSHSMMRKVNRNLDKYLDIDEVQPAMGAFGPIYEKVPIGKKVRGKKQQFKKVRVMKIDTSILKLKLQTTEFVAETLGKDIYSKNTGKPGAVTFNFNKINENIDKYK